MLQIDLIRPQALGEGAGWGVDMLTAGSCLISQVVLWEEKETLKKQSVEGRDGLRHNVAALFSSHRGTNWPGIIVLPPWANMQTVGAAAPCGTVHTARGSTKEGALAVCLTAI